MMGLWQMSTFTQILETMFLPYAKETVSAWEFPQTV